MLAPAGRAAFTACRARAMLPPHLQNQVPGLKARKWSGIEPRCAVFLCPAFQLWAIGQGSRKARRCSTGLSTLFGRPPD